MSRIFSILLLITLSLHAITLTKEYSYAASESDSKASAKAQALKTLKNLTIEELGSGMATRFESNERVTNESMKSEIRSSVKSFTSAFIQSKIIDESWDGSIYWLKARIDVDEEGLYAKTLTHYKELQAQALSEDLEAMLEDISTKEKLDAFIEKVITLEFDQKLGSKLHLKTLQVFNYYKIYDERYRDFLIQTLAKIDYPSWDIRAESILYYLQNDRPYDAKERKILLKILENVKVAQSSRFLTPMLQPNARACDKGVQELMEAYIELVLDKKAALPVYTNLQKECNSILEGWAQSQNSTCPFLGSEALIDALKSKQAATLSGETWTRALQKTTSATTKNSSHAMEKLLPLIAIIAPNLPQERGAKDAIIALYKKAPLELHGELTELLREPIERIFGAETLYEDEITFCITHGISIANKVFTLEQYYEKLFNETKQSNRRAWVKAITNFTEANSGANHKSYLDALEFLDQQNDHYHAEILLNVMERSEYDDARSITLLTKFIASENPNLSKRAKNYLLTTQNQKQRVATIIQALEELNNMQKKRAITFLLNFKHEAAQALVFLEKYKNSNDSELRYALEWLEKNLKKEGYL